MKIRTKLTYGFSLITLILLIIGLFISYNITRMGDQFNFLVEHDLNVLQNGQELHKLVVDAETGQRGYIITRKDEFLEPYNNSLSSFEILLNEEKALVSDNIPQVERLSRIGSLFFKWQEVAAIPEIEARRDSTLNYARQLVEMGTGKAVLDQIREEFNKFIQIENNLEQIRKTEAQQIERITKLTVLLGTILSILLLLAVAIIFLRSFTPAINQLLSATVKISEGDLNIQVPIVGNDEITELAHSFNNMAGNFRISTKINENSLWLQSGITTISEYFSGEFKIPEMTKNVLTKLIVFLEAQIGTFYLLDNNNNNLTLLASYGINLEKIKHQVSVGEGLVGQIALTKKPLFLNNIPENYTNVSSSVISIQPNNIAIVPVIFENKVLGVIEIASIKSITDLQLNLLNEISARLGAAINLAKNRDILRINDEELKEKNEMLESQNIELEHFAYIVSHDLKAPLRAISTLSAFIDEDLRANKNEEVYSHLDTMNTRIQRMENLIEGILDFSKIGMTKPEKEVFDLNIIVNEIYENIYAPEHFEFKVVTPLPSITGTKTLYIQMFSNLISNAINYNDKSKGVLKITYKELQNSHIFSISDNGPGIAKKYHQKIFIAFQTLNSKDTVESTGIGLSIVQKIITHLNGSIKIESAENEGAKFVIDIPKN